ncbi:MAG TPA: TIR domain-containing protein [Pyrinomonadaceae bacterium]
MLKRIGSFVNVVVSFKLEEIENATGWLIPTIKTYIAKRWNEFLQPAGPGLYRVLDFDFSEEEFLAQQSQLAPRYDYDVTLSFAGEDRAYVEKIAAALYALGIRVFYDRYEQVDLWGKDLYTHLDDVYHKRAQFCIVFISRHYADKVWTNHERKSAQARAFKEKSEYILPVRFDDTEVPGILPTIGYIDGTSREPAETALIIAKKTGMDTDLQGTSQLFAIHFLVIVLNSRGRKFAFIVREHLATQLSQHVS